LQRQEKKLYKMTFRIQSKMSGGKGIGLSKKEGGIRGYWDGIMLPAILPERFV